MTEDARTQDDDSPVAVALHLPLDFEAFYLRTQDAYHQYAFARLGSVEMADEVVHGTFAEIRRHWDALLRTCFQTVPMLGVSRAAGAHG